MSEQVQAEFAAVGEPDWADRAAVLDYLAEQERLCAAPSVPFDLAGIRAAMAQVVDRTPDVRSMLNHFMVIGGDAPRHRPAEIRRAHPGAARREDPLFPLPHGAALAAEIAGARLVTLPQVGHEWPRRAWERALPEILAHTATPPPPPPPPPAC